MHVNQLGKIAQNIVRANGLTKDSSRDEIRSAVARFSIDTAWTPMTITRLEVRVEQVLTGEY